MNLFSEIKSLVLDCLAQMEADNRLPAGLDLSNVSVEPPRDAAHGDMATNAAMVLAKPAGQKPRDIAEALAEHLLSDDRVTQAEVAGPGFLNLRLDPALWSAVIPAAIRAGADFGRSALGQGKKINVEYVSANPTGPLHVGHTRGAVFGDALASLLDFAGYDVTKEYYINDGGAQVDMLARSAYLRYQEACGRSVEFPDGTYPGDYLIPVGHALKEKYGEKLLGSNNEDWLPEIREFVTDQMMQLIRDDLGSLGVNMDVYFSEKSLYGTGRIEAAIESLKARDLVYWGALPPPKGKKTDDWEKREQWLFRSTAFGDDEDRPVQKSDGSWAYFAPDIAYHCDKVERGFDELIDVFGADHGGYVKRMKAAVAALSEERVPLDIKLTQLVKLFKDGQEFKMSKRAGTFVTLRDLIDEVGPDVVRFVMLTRKNDAKLDFDFSKALEQSKDNPVFYVQYAHARVHSVLRRAGEAGIAHEDADLASADLSLLTHPEELALTRKLADWPRQAELAARHHEPHRVAFYLYELAQVFHGLQHLGKQDAALRFVSEENHAQSSARLALVRAVSVVISAGLGILGVTPKTEM